MKGLILTGFDNDHSEIVGASIVLRKYRPDWIMYPKYYKDSDEAKRVFALINEEVKSAPLVQQARSKKMSVRVDQLANRSLTGLSDKFDFELFSPHIEDMDSSNNCSIVLKLTGRGSARLLLPDHRRHREPALGDDQQAVRQRAQVARACRPHHGSKNATHPASLLNIAPHTVLISAGVDSQYGHPHPQALQVYSRVAKHVFSTNMEGGVSLLTQPGATELTTTLIRSGQHVGEAA